MLLTENFQQLLPAARYCYYKIIAKKFVNSKKILNSTAVHGILQYTFFSWAMPGPSTSIP